MSSFRIRGRDRLNLNVLEEWMMEELMHWRTYLERPASALNFEPHDGYAPRNTREVMKGLWEWTSDGIRS